MLSLFLQLRDLPTIYRVICRDHQVTARTVRHDLEWARRRILLCLYLDPLGEGLGDLLEP